jgi:murein DD-endopeptidase MepM/ murein hydrolase activator NlpD
MTTRPLSSTGPEARAAASQLEAMLVKQMLEASGMGKSLSGVPVQQGMFLDALANAVAQGGGLGLAKNLVPKATNDTQQLAQELLAGPATVSSGFGPRVDPVDGSAEYHQGVDLAATAGTPVLAALPGVVSRVAEDEGYGRHVVVTHANGAESLYAHMEEAKVTVGQRVEAGQPLGLVGNTGRSTGPHLHFELQLQGKRVDPTLALKTYSHVSNPYVPPVQERRTP